MYCFLIRKFLLDDKISRNIYIKLIKPKLNDKTSYNITKFKKNYKSNLSLVST